MLSAGIYFNPRSHKGSDETIGKLSMIYIFQSTLPQRERQADEGFNKANQISIHAPTKGATKQGEQLSLLTEISIHAPTKGATEYIQDAVGTYDISIHAPTKGATCCIIICYVFFQFQSTLPQRERRGTVAKLARLSELFQSTLPQRERLNHFFLAEITTRFQSTLPQRERPVKSAN